MFEDLRCLGMGPAFAPSDTKSRFLPDTSFDTEHVRLELNVDLRRKELSGACHTTLVALRSGARTLSFDAVAMRIGGVREGTRPLRFRHDGKVLEVKLARPLAAGERRTVEIRYGTRDPEAGVRFIDDPPQMWTQGQTDDARCWFPCRDVPAEKATTEIRVTVPPGFRAVSNGILVKQEGNSFHWKMDVPHSLYLVTLTVGRFSEIREEWDGIPVTYYCEQGREGDARRAFGKTPRMMDFFSKKTGVRYPYAKYAQIAAADFPGGMENTSATTQTDVALYDAEAAIDTDFDGLVAHELAHQWFGDLVTCADWSHAWLNESFATYFDLLWAEFDLGRDEFWYKLSKEAAGYFDESSDYQRPTATRKWRESFQLFDRHLYDRGACVLRFFHQRLGDDAWWRGIRHYLEKHRTREVETPDLIQALREATGMNLESAFDEWIYRPGHPDLHAHYSWDRGAVRLWVVQKDEKNLYTLPLGVRLDDEVYTTEVKNREHVFTFRRKGPPRLVTLDPEYHIPVKKVEWVKPPEMWDHQLNQDPSPIGRIDAAQAVAARGTSTAVALLERSFLREKFWGVRAEIARALGRVGTDAALEALNRLTSTSHPKARRAAVEALGEFRDARVLRRMEALLRDPSIHVRSEAVRTAARSGHPGARKLVERAWKMDSWNDTIRAACVDAVASLDGRLEAIRPYLKPGQSRSVRLAAVRQLPRLAKGRPEGTRLLLDLVQDRSEWVQITALSMLGKMGDPMAVKELQRLVKEDVNSRIRSISDRMVRVLRLGMNGDAPKPTVVSPNR